MKVVKKVLAVLSAAVMSACFGLFVGCGSGGVSVESVTVDGNGNLIVRFSDGTTRNAGKVNGQNGTDGRDGISVQEVYIDKNGGLIVIFSDGSRYNAGNVNPQSMTLNKAANFSTGFSDADGGVAEIVKYNTDNGKFYLVNGKTQTLDIVSLSVYSEGAGELETIFDEAAGRIRFDDMVSAHAADFAENFVVGDITSVAVNTELDLIAVALQHEDYSRAGAIVLLNYDGSYVKAYSCGVQPDMITFGGNLVLTADEGEPREGYGEGTADPMGSVTVLDISAGVQNGEVTVATFESFDDRRGELTQSGVIVKKDTSPSVDFEPEYIAVGGDYAYVALQEANAIASLDLRTKSFVSVLPLGFKDHSAEGNGLDLLTDGKISIETQNVYGVYMPDGIDAFTYKGETYLATANEGDAREWGDYSGVTKTKIGEYQAETLDNAEWDGIDEEKIYVLGGRSFSIFRASDMSLVFDSGDMIESAVAESAYAAYFNCSNDNVTLDARSKKKGPEPETILVRAVGDKLYAFVGLERVSGIMTFDITHFLYGDAALEDYTSTRDYSQAMAGDVAPEGLDFVYASEATAGKNLVIAANENSGTVAIYALENTKKSYTMHETFIAIGDDGKGDDGENQTSSALLIYSVHGSGGNVDGTVSHDYIAIKNISDSELSLEGYALGYSSGGSAWQELQLDGEIGAGEIYIVRCAAANTSTAVINIGDGDYRVEWNGLSIDNKTFSVRLTRSGAVADALGVSTSGTGETYEGTIVTDMSKQKIVIRKSDADTNDNANDFEVVSFKNLTADSETVTAYLVKLGLF